MPVGMTLQQLYSQPTYHGGDGSSGVGAPTATSMSMSNATINPSAKRAGSPNTTAFPQPSDKEYASRSLHDGGAFPPDQRAQYHDHHSSMQQQQQHYPPAFGQLPPPHAYAQYHPKQHTQQQQPPHGSDEYGMADPLPFEYMGMRKFPDAMKDHADHRYAAPPPQQQMGGGQYQGSYGAHSPHPSVYESQHAHPPKSVEERAFHQPYPHHVSNDRTPNGGGYHNNNDPTGHFPHGPHANMPPHLYSNHMNSAPPPPPPPPQQQQPQHSFPPLIETQNLKKETAGVNGGADPHAYSPHGPVEFTTSGPNGSTSAAGQEAVIKVKTPLKTKYWRNGRRNLQCFPSCKVFGDYSSIKIEDLKQHDFMWGKCRGSLITEVTLNSSVSFDDVLLLSRVHSMENVPVAFEEAVIRECMLGRMVEPEVMDSMKDQWITGERLPDFVQQEGNTACYEFKPKVWKYTEDMTQGKCKRRNVKYYVQFEAFVLVMSGERRYYACIGSGMSTAFEVGSSRVLARQKRKAATGLDANPLYLKNGQPVGSPGDMSPPPPMHQQQQQQQQQHPMMQQQQQQQQQHSMMGMHPQMYPPSYGYAPANRGMPQGMHPSMMPPPPPMHHHHHHHPADTQLHPAYHHQHPQQQSLPLPMNPQPPVPPQAGQKRKASPTNAAPRATKAKKASAPLSNM